MAWSAGDTVLVQEVWRRRVWAARPMTVVRDDTWYVNLQEPLRRTPLGFETMDLALDVVVFADGSMRWKDEDKLAVFVGRGVIDPADAAELRDEGLRAVDRLRRGDPPFDEPWATWRPDPGWAWPGLADGWEAPCR